MYAYINTTKIKKRAHELEREQDRGYGSGGQNRDIMIQLYFNF